MSVAPQGRSDICSLTPGWHLNGKQINSCCAWLKQLEVLQVGKYLDLVLNPLVHSKQEHRNIRQLLWNYFFSLCLPMSTLEDGHAACACIVHRVRSLLQRGQCDPWPQLLTLLLCRYGWLPAWPGLVRSCSPSHERTTVSEVLGDHRACLFPLRRFNWRDCLVQMEVFKKIKSKDLINKSNSMAIGEMLIFLFIIHPCN